MTSEQALSRIESLGWRETHKSFAGVSDESHVFRVVAVHRRSIRINNGLETLSMGRSTLPQAVSEQVTVGDWLAATPNASICILPRSTLLRRRHAGQTQKVQNIVANADAVVVTTSCNREFSEERLERYMVQVLASGALPIICLTKSDLASRAERFRERAESIANGCNVLLVNSRDSKEVSQLRPYFESNQSVAFVGSSGVGKTTLINSLLGSDVLATQEVRGRDQRGRHTTSARVLVPLPSGGVAIDVPGVREIGIVSSKKVLEDYFADITGPATHCRFSNCAHDREPDCAVQTGILSGQIRERRLLSFLSLSSENLELN